MDQTTLEAKSGSVRGNPRHRPFGSSQKPFYLTFGSFPTLKQAIEVIPSLSQVMGPIFSRVVNRWVQRYAPEIEKRLRWHWRRPQSTSWRVDETYVKVR
jgi:hypothetical protein